MKKLAEYRIKRIRFIKELVKNDNKIKVITKIITRIDKKALRGWFQQT